MINNYATDWLLVMTDNRTTARLSNMINNIINYIGTQHGPIVGPQSDCSGLWATINTYLHGIMVWSQSWSIIWWYGPKVSMVPKYGPKVGTARHSWYFGTIGTLEHWNGWNIVLWNIGTVGTLVRLGPYLGIIFVNIISLSTSFLCQWHISVSTISLSAPFLCQHHFFVSYMLLSVTCYYQRHIFVNNTSLSVNHICQSSVGMEWCFLEWCFLEWCFLEWCFVERYSLEWCFWNDIPWNAWDCWKASIVME